MFFSSVTFCLGIDHDDSPPHLKQHIPKLLNFTISCNNKILETVKVAGEMIYVPPNQYYFSVK